MVMLCGRECNSGVAESTGNCTMLLSTGCPVSALASMVVQVFLYLLPLIIADLAGYNLNRVPPLVQTAGLTPNGLQKNGWLNKNRSGSSSSIISNIFTSCASILSVHLIFCLCTCCQLLVYNVHLIFFIIQFTAS